MRSDMKKVVVERPRWGSRVRNQKFGKKLRYIPGHDYEEEPKKARGFESFHDGFGKLFTDVLGPLYRYLDSNVGRPWNKIYSEMCAGLDKRKTTGRHIFQHVEQMVERDCYVGEDGKVRYSRYRNHILGGGGSREVCGFYVHPRTGLLCLAPRESRRERKRKLLSSPEEVTRLYVDNSFGYQKHEGIWYRVKLSRIVVDSKIPSPRCTTSFSNRSYASTGA